jgi:hypothetical protein
LQGNHLFTFALIGDSISLRMSYRNASPIQEMLICAQLGRVGVMNRTTKLLSSNETLWMSVLELLEKAKANHK